MSNIIKQLAWLKGQVICLSKGLDNFSRSIVVENASLPAGATLEVQVVTYVNSLSYYKKDLDADIWVNVLNTVSGTVQYRILNKGKGLLEITTANLELVSGGGGTVIGSSKVVYAEQGLTMIAHGFTTGDNVYFDGVNWVAALATAFSTLKQGLVEVIDIDNINILSYGTIDIGIHGFPLASTYFLSTTVAGGNTAIAPTTVSQYVQATFEVISDTKIKVLDQAVSLPEGGAIVASSATTVYIDRDVTQIAHGFTTLTSVYFDGTNWVKAIASSVATLMQGIIVNLGVDTFDVVSYGIINVPLHGATLRDIYYLSSTLIGQPALAPPTPPGLVQELWEVIDADNIKVLDRDASASTIVANALLEDAAVTGTFDIDWDYATIDLNLTGNTVFTDINLPIAGETKRITLIVVPNGFTMTFPALWGDIDPVETLLDNVQGYAVGGQINITAPEPLPSTIRVVVNGLQLLDDKYSVLGAVVTLTTPMTAGDEFILGYAVKRTVAITGKVFYRTEFITAGDYWVTITEEAVIAAVTDFAASSTLTDRITMTWSDIVTVLPTTYDLYESGTGLIRTNILSPYDFLAPPGTAGNFYIRAVNDDGTSTSNVDPGVVITLSSFDILIHSISRPVPTANVPITIVDNLDGTWSLTSADIVKSLNFAYSTTNLDITQLIVNTCDALETMYNFGGGLENCVNLDLTGMNTSFVTNMTHAFSQMYALASLDVSMLNTSNVTEFVNCFYRSSSLTSINLTGWDFSKANNMQAMFWKCTNLTCISYLDTTAASIIRRDNIFLDSAVTTPNAAEQTALTTDPSGAVYGPIACP